MVLLSERVPLSWSKNKDSINLPNIRYHWILLSFDRDNRMVGVWSEDGAFRKKRTIAPKSVNLLPTMSTKGCWNRVKRIKVFKMVERPGSIKTRDFAETCI